MRRAFAEHDVDQPRILSKFDSMEEVERFDWGSVRFPAIVKPVDMTASMHVRLCDDARAAKQILQRIFRHTQSFSGLSFVAQGLLEEAVFGPEYSAECVVQNGGLIRLFSTTKFVSPFPACDEVGHLSGEPLSASISGQLVDTIERIVKAWALEAGVMHIEYKICGDRVNVIEGACRVGGDMISELVELKYGVSLEECLLLLRSRRAVSPAFKNEAADSDYYYGIKYLFDQHIGTLTAPSDIDILRESWKEEARGARRGGSGFGVERRLGHQLVRSRSLTNLKAYLAKLEMSEAVARYA
jgi:biotin carboxylase